MAVSPAALAAADCADCHEIDPARYADSVHGQLDCLDCHEGADQRRHRRGLEAVDCAACHDEAVAAHESGVHGGANGEPNGDAAFPTCTDCHGDPHAIGPAGDPGSAVHRGRQAEVCAQCHGAGQPGETRFRTVRPIEAYLASVHATSAAAGRGGAVCSDCHTAHSALPATDPGSSVHRANVPAMCGACHASVTAAFAESIHGLAAGAGVTDAPVCTDCHGEHRLLAATDEGSPVAATNIPTMVCGPCHADLRLSEKYGLSTGSVPSYADSYHGLAARGGVQRVANCASCHGVHNILPSSDPRSHVHVDNLPQTCGKCHEGAGKRFGIDPVHVLGASTPNVVAYWIRKIYIPLIWIVVGGMLLHNLVDLLSKARTAQPRRRRAPPGYRIMQRMSVPMRIAHGTMVVSFLVLVVTGFALEYPESWWATLLRPLGPGIELRGLIHRLAGLGLMAAIGFHLLHVIVSRKARRQIAAFIPGLRDIREFKERVGYNLGRRAQPPAPVRVGYIEKLEYWAALWGSLITAATGLLLWFENFTLAYLPAWVPEAATTLHLYEAILAALSIAVWHFYWVIFDPLVYPMDMTWLTGKPPFERAHERGEVIEDDAPGPEQ